MANSKYFSNDEVDPVDFLYQQNARLVQRIDDLERELRNQYAAPAIPRIDPTTYPNPFEGQRAIDVADEQHTWYSNGQWRKAASGGFAVYEIKVFEDVNTVAVGDGRFIWEIPEELNNAEIVSVEAFVTTVSSSGSVQIQIGHQPGGSGGITDILSTKITIEASEKNSKDAATQPVISGGSWLVNWGDHLYCDVDAAGVGAKGLGLIVTLIPSPLGSVAIAGNVGPAGGITAWRGDWQTATSYVIGDAVNNNGTTYVAIADHTSGATTEPGVGASWQTDWMILVQGHQFSSLGYVMDGAGLVLETGIKGSGLPIYSNCVIREVTLLADTAGSIVVDIWKDTYGAYPPTNADSICASSKPTLASAIKTTDTTLTGWTTSITAGDTLRFNIESISLIRSVTVGFKLERT